MALIGCPKCKKQVSDSADYCPNCKTNIKEHLQMLKKKKKMLEEIKKEAELKNTKCPDCNQSLSWQKYKRCSDWGGRYDIYYQSSCANCGYTNGQPRNYSYEFLGNL
jgi:predicted amidophosphoribosyltransferase